MDMDGPPPPLDPSLAPVLVFNQEEASTNKLVYSIPKRQLLRAKGLDRFVDNVNWVTPQGWVLTVDSGTRDASLCSPFTSRTLRLPRDDEGLLLAGGKDTRCFLSTPQPTDPGCIVLVTHPTEPAFCYYRPGSSSRWYRHEYWPEDIDEDSDGVCRAMASLVGAAAKFYVRVNDNKVATLEFSPDPTFTTVHVSSRPRPLGCCYVQYCELESCGDLFKVQFWYTPLSGRRILRVQVQKLDWSTSAWVKATGLGVNRVFFVQWPRFGASMAADELGVKADCIYFSKDGDKGLYIHDLEQGTTTLHNPGSDVPSSPEPTLLMDASI